MLLLAGVPAETSPDDNFTSADASLDAPLDAAADESEPLDAPGGTLVAAPAGVLAAEEGTAAAAGATPAAARARRAWAPGEGTGRLSLPSGMSSSTMGCSGWASSYAWSTVKYPSRSSCKKAPRLSFFKFASPQAVYSILESGLNISATGASGAGSAGTGAPGRDLTFLGALASLMSGPSRTTCSAVRASSTSASQVSLRKVSLAFQPGTCLAVMPVTAPLASFSIAVMSTAGHSPQSISVTCRRSAAFFSLSGLGLPSAPAVVPASASATAAATSAASTASISTLRSLMVVLFPMDGSFL
mmetsp:Transcript_4615/g.13254  ORF Transcript_4615/g.13254 Transcript_4615/m.13254 type:complete len:301 (-) Transcript_4615:1929-2831(-)